MAAVTRAPAPGRPITYPESDGQPTAENTKQFRWIVTVEGGLEALFRNDPDVFVAGDLLWYPVEGRPDTCTAPDALVVFGRPKGDRGAYLQWREGDIAPQVVFEILSPGNTVAEMTRKFRFYERHGVEEYYLYDPDDGELSGWRRRGGEFEEIEQMVGWVSPRTGVRFGLEAGELQLFRPDGERFATYLELMAQQEQARQRAAEEHRRAEQEAQRAEQERERAEQAAQRAERLAAQLRALGVEPLNS
ncbi:MAG: Uma2 family endonuclease [Chloroflexota bacterium]